MARKDNPWLSDEGVEPSVAQSTSPRTSNPWISDETEPPGSAVQTASQPADDWLKDWHPQVKEYKERSEQAVQPKTEVAPKVEHRIPEGRLEAERPVAAGEPELSVGETLSRAATNLPRSVAEQFSTMGHAISHPGETLSALGSLGTGAVSKAVGMLGVAQDPAKKAEAERAIDALAAHYKQVYGTSPQQFARALSEDPASILMDLSMVLGAGAPALAGRAAKVARIASTVTDPTQLALSAARGVASLGPKALAGIQATTSKTPYRALQAAYDIGRAGTPAQKAAFKEGRAIDELGLQRKWTEAVAKSAQAAENSYLSDMAKQGLLKQAPDFQSVIDKIQKEKDSLLIDGELPTIKLPDGTIVPEPVTLEAWNTLHSIENNLTGYGKSPTFNLVEADKYKKLLREQARSAGSALLSKKYNAIAADVRDAIARKAPEYSGIMERWQDWLAQSKDIKGAGSGESTERSIAKMMKAMKSDKKNNPVDFLAKEAPELPHLLAGYATKSMHAGGINLMEALLGAGGWLAMSHPIGAVGAVALASPRIGSMSQYALGKGAKAGSKATSRPVTYGAYAAERALQGAPQQPSDQDIDALTRAVLGEAAGEPPEGQAGVAHVALNRASRSGRSLADVVHEPNAFESITTGAANRYAPDSPEYQHIRNAVALPVLRGEVADPTGGATHFLNPELQARLNREMPSWAQGEGKRIGAHVFYKLPKEDEESPHRAARATGGSVKINHADEAKRLIALADKAKKLHNQSTEQLLALPDEHVTKALQIANESI